jgi:hypothetical protein
VESGLDSSCSGQRLVAGSSEHGIEPQGSIKCWKILEWLRNSWLIKKDSAQWSYFATWDSTDWYWHQPSDFVGRGERSRGMQFADGHKREKQWPPAVTNRTRLSRKVQGSYFERLLSIRGQVFQGCLVVSTNGRNLFVDRDSCFWVNRYSIGIVLENIIGSWFAVIISVKFQTFNCWNILNKEYRLILLEDTLV